MAHISKLIENSFFELLAKCPFERFEKLFHHLIDLFCGQQISLYEQFSDIWTLIEWFDLISGSKKFLNHKSNNELLEDSLLSSEVLELLKKCLNVRNEDLHSAMIEKWHEISPSYLKDFDWKVKFTLSSDKMAQINKPSLILDLDLIGNENKSIRLDLSKDDLKHFVDSMEKANKALQEVACD